MLHWQKDCSLLFLKKLQRWKWISASRARSSLHCMPTHQKCFIRHICRKGGAEIIHIWLLSDCFCYLFKALRLLLRLMCITTFWSACYCTLYLECILEAQQKLSVTEDCRSTNGRHSLVLGLFNNLPCKNEVLYIQLSLNQVSFSLATMQMGWSIKRYQTRLF